MNKTLVFLLIGILLSCGSQSVVEKPKILPLIPTEVLLQNDIVPINNQYKSRYYEMLPYLYFNGRVDFNKIQGDFYNLKHPKLSSVNLMAGFWQKYGKHKNVLLAVIGVYANNRVQLEALDIKVISSKHGVLENSPVKTTQYNGNGFYKRYLFVKKIELEKSYDIINKLHDDVLTFEIENYKYEMLNPELKLN